MLALARYEEAQASFDRALALRPGDSATLTNRGTALVKLRRSDEAFAVMRRTFSLVEGAADQVQEAVDWLTYRQAWPIALEVLQKFDAVVQDNPRLLYRLASIYDKLEVKRRVQAIEKARWLALIP